MAMLRNPPWLGAGLLALSLVGCQLDGGGEAPADRQPEPIAARPAGDELAPGAEPGAGAPAEELGPHQTDLARAFYVQGVSLLQVKPPRVDEAIREFQQALEIDPLFYKAHFKLGVCYYHKGRYELEIGEYRKALSINSRYAPALLNLGHAYLAQDQLEAARDAYERLLDIEPNHTIALYNLGLVQFDLNNRDESFRRLTRFLDLNGPDGELSEHARRYLSVMNQRRPGGGS